MTHEEWQPIARFLETAWNDRWSREKANSYYSFMKDHEQDEIRKAIMLLRNAGFENRPKPSEILAAVNCISDEFIPGWNVVWNGMGVAAHMDRDDQATYFLERTVHPYVLSFVNRIGGLPAIRRMKYDGPRGAELRAELRLQWQAFLKGKRALITPRRKGLRDQAVLMNINERLAA
jgi:hypothetical protein